MEKLFCRELRAPGASLSHENLLDTCSNTVRHKTTDCVEKGHSLKNSALFLIFNPIKTNAYAFDVRQNWSKLLKSRLFQQNRPLPAIRSIALDVGRLPMSSLNA